MASPLDSLPQWANIDVLANLAASMPSVQRLITGFAYVMGLFFGFKALVTLKHHGENKSSMGMGERGMKEPLVYMFVAGILIYLPTAMTMMLQTTFGQSNILAYAPIENGSSGFMSSLFGGNQVIGEAVVLIIQTIGLIAFIRGWVLLVRAAGHGQQPGQATKGMVHIFGGLLAINIVLTVQIINNTLFGTS